MFSMRFTASNPHTFPCIVFIYVLLLSAVFYSVFSQWLSILIGTIKVSSSEQPGTQVEAVWYKAGLHENLQLTVAEGTAA